MIYKYPYPEKFEEFEKIDFKKYSGNLVVWGAGRIGGMAAHCLKQQKVEICAFCDVAEDKWGKEFCGHTIICPSDLKEKYPNAAVLISTVFHTVISEDLKKMGYNKIFDCSSLFMEIDFTNYDFWMEPDYAIRNVEQYLGAIYEQTFKTNKIDQIFLNITTKCSLCCRDCSMFIPYVTSPCNYDANVIMNDFFNVLDCLGHIRIVNFYGGEPLLHPHLAEMIEKLKDDNRIDRISIITNATIMLNEKLLSVLENEKRTWVRISDYGALSSKSEDIKKVLEDRKIKYEIANYTYWDAPSQIGFTAEDEETLKRKFEECTACNVIFLLNRKLYLCSTGSAVNNIGAFPLSESNYVDMEKYNEEKETLYKKIKEYIDRPKKKEYLDACRYCSGGHCIQFENKHPVAVQTSKRLEFDKVSKCEEK